MIHVFGHKNPDSDSICSALVIADWLNAQGRQATPWRLGDLRTETRMDALDQSARLNELARLLGGDQITDITLAHARELLHH